MVTRAARRQHQRWLVELTGVPTASGREQRVVDWVRRWVSARKDLRLAADAAGNLVITRRGRAGRTRGTGRRPLFFTAHMDHPAFVVRRGVDARRVELEFRGGVHDPYFDGALLEVIDAAGRCHKARIVEFDGPARPYKLAVAEMARRAPQIVPGDIARWAFGARGSSKPLIHGGLLHAPACDDLAGVAAALSALDALRRSPPAAHVGVLLTVAEEVGFIGAIAACKHKTVPRDASLICLENSRSFADSPIGGGPIVRVGDRLSVFSPALTNRIGALLREPPGAGPAPRHQRKLMPGGTCEATAFASYGYEATCLCLALGNYHNMADIDAVQAGAKPARVAPEFISVEDYHGLVDVLVLCALHLGESRRDGGLRDRMEALYREHSNVLG